MQRSKWNVMMAATVVVVAALGMSACGSDSDASSSDSKDSKSTTTTAAASSSSDLDGTTWTSTNVMGHDLVAGSTITLTFTDGDLAIVAGCNTMSGAYSVDGDTLTLDGQSRTTMMGCEQDLMDQDQWLVTWFTDGVTMTTTDAGMTLAGGDVSVEFTKGGDDVPSELVGPTWTLESTTTAGAASSVPTSVQAPTLVFVADGTVNVFAGCNTGSTTVTTSGTTLTFSPMALTRMACEEPASTLETTVTAVLDGDVAYVIEGNQLTLTNGDTSLTYAGN